MKRETEIDELKQFLSDYSTAAISPEPELQKAVGRIYKRHRPLLVWKVELEKDTLWKNASKEKLFRMYCAEMNSDLAQTIFLYYQGLYKPARLLLRSAVENFFRCICIADDINIGTLANTYNLIASAKASAPVARDSSSKAAFDRLHQTYKELCKYVHGAAESNLSLIEFLGAFPKFDGRSAPSVEKQIIVTAVGINSILALMFSTRLGRLHHRHRDMIFDVLPQKVRLALMN